MAMSAPPEGFSTYVQQQLQAYVYLLRDPTHDLEIFYVGKGRGNRCFAHARDALETEVEGDKLARIRTIHSAGQNVFIELLRSGLTDAVAFEVEAATMQLLPKLSNIQAGHHVAMRGRMTPQVAISMFEAPAAPPITDPVILIRIPKLWYPGIDPGALYEATSGWWGLGPRRNKVKFAFSVNHGVVREVYSIASWRARLPGDRDAEDDPPGKPRWGFVGEVAPAMDRYRNTSVKSYFKPGSQGPIYLNC